MRRGIALVGTVLVVAPGTDISAPAGGVQSPAHIERGDRVEARYAAYRARLARTYETLSTRVHEDAADLEPRFSRAAPRPVVHGYGIVPRLVAEPPRAERARVAPGSYSWPRTERLIERETQGLERLAGELERVAALDPTKRRPVYEEAIATYLELFAGLRTIDAHVRYNRLWQAAIAADKTGYDRQTVLQRAVLERQAIRDAVAILDDAGFRKAVERVEGIDRSASRGALEAMVQEREAKLSRSIQDSTDAIAVPSFVRIAHAQPRLWVVSVPFFTDVEDTEFVRSFKGEVERVWHVRDGEDEFRVELTITVIPPARLYGGRAPARGAQVDLQAHAARFPGDGGVLTTGALTTHLMAGRCIALGPHDIGGHVLAHEFGHVLGFRDVYFRGYRDLGADGYEVTEVVADPDDIMGAPGSGPVLRRHFERIRSAAEGRVQPR